MNGNLRICGMTSLTSLSLQHKNLLTFSSGPSGHGRLKSNHSIDLIRFWLFRWLNAMESDVPSTNSWMWNRSDVKSIFLSLPCRAVQPRFIFIREAVDEPPDLIFPCEPNKMYAMCDPFNFSHNIFQLTLSVWMWLEWLHWSRLRHPNQQMHRHRRKTNPIRFSQMKMLRTWIR